MLNPNEQKLTKKMNMCIVSRFFGPKEEIKQKKTSLHRSPYNLFSLKTWIAVAIAVGGGCGCGVCIIATNVVRVSTTTNNRSDGCCKRCSEVRICRNGCSGGTNSVRKWVLLPQLLPLALVHVLWHLQTRKFWLVLKGLAKYLRQQWGGGGIGKWDLELGWWPLEL